MTGWVLRNISADDALQISR